MQMDQDNSASWAVGRPLTIGLITLVVLLGGFGGWAVFTQIAGAIIASGRIEVDQNRQVVQHLDGGIVEEILIDTGDTVDAGQVLIRLDGTQLRSELAIAQGQLHEFMARRARLEAERDEEGEVRFDETLLAAAALNPDVADVVDGQLRLFLARRDSLAREVEQLEKRMAQIANQIEGITAQQDALGVQLELMRAELADVQQLLDGGLAQKPRLLALQREEARLAGTLGELIAQQAESEGRITEIEIQMLSLENQRREEAITELRNLRFREFELIEQIRALEEQIARLEIKAPVAGVIYDLQVFALRSVVRAADPVMYIVPQDDALVIAAQVEPIHIDQVFPGQEVTVRFSALDQTRTPELTGRVTTVSADALTDEQTGFSYYRTELILPEGETDRLPDDVTLLPGMPVEAFLRTDDRTPLAYLLKPLTDYFVKAFRES